MQHTPLTLDLAVERAATLFSGSTVTSAVVGGFRQRTYAQLTARIGRVAGALAELGLGRGERVATFAFNSDHHLELQAGIPCAGAILVPLNLRLAPERLAHILDDADVRAVFVDPRAADAWEPVGRLRPVDRVVRLDDEYELLLGAPPVAVPPLREEDALAICFTSGTTGRPKGVVYSHRSAVLHALAGLLADGIGLRERDVCLPVVPQFHALAWGLPYSALLAGSGLALPGPDVRPEALAALIERARVTVGSGIASVWLALLDALDAGAVRREQLASLERLYCGGAPVPDRLFDRCATLGVEVLAAWGMTETSPVATVARVKRGLGGDEARRARRSLGIPFPLLRSRAVAQDGAEVPWDGESTGELQVSGPWVADAYFDPVASNGRGGEDRFDVDTGGRRWLRTGDVVTIDREGYAHMVDRTNDMIRSGGEWISSLELERHLLAHPAVADAAVIAVRHERWGERPLAIVVAPGLVDVGELRAHMEERVPRWQVPDGFARVEELPRTGVGKIDKRALRDAHSRSASSQVGDSLDFRHEGRVEGQRNPI